VLLDRERSRPRPTLHVHLSGCAGTRRRRPSIANYSTFPPGRWVLRILSLIISPINWPGC
jgi:hypothetical protein